MDYPQARKVAIRRAVRTQTPHQIEWGLGGYDVRAGSSHRCAIVVYPDGEIWHPDGDVEMFDPEEA